MMPDDPLILETRSGQNLPQTLERELTLIPESKAIGTSMRDEPVLIVTFRVPVDLRPAQFVGARFIGSDLDRLSALADAIIPAADGMPAAGAISAAPRMVARVLGVRPDLLEGLRIAVAKPVG